MTGVEQSVSRHYMHGSLESAILQALTAAGKNIDRLEPADLAPVDEFHVGGRQATADFAQQIGVVPGMQLLDIGWVSAALLVILRVSTVAGWPASI